MQDLVCPSWRAPRGVVLLAPSAPLALQPVGEQALIDWMLHAMLTRSAAEVVVVTGPAGEVLEAHVRAHYGPRARCVRGARHESAADLGAVEAGVAALRHPERGYLVAEAALLLDDEAWDHVFDTLELSGDSFWACRGLYGPGRTGGAVRARLNGTIDAIEDRPQHDPACDGWPRLFGLLAVGSREVAVDRALRRAALAESTTQPFQRPWQEHRSQLPCRVLGLDRGFAARCDPLHAPTLVARFLDAMAVTA
jgi:hypothetical protein